MSHAQHEQSAASITARCAIITLSDTRIAETDKSGSLIKDLLASAGHTVADYAILPDDPSRLEPHLLSLLSNPAIDAILTNGGTGISRRDQTIAVVEKLLTQPLPGFGELFRMLSYAQIGPPAILSRAAAGIAQGTAQAKPLFAMPGSTKAVELAMTKLILPEIKHILFELRKQS
jgi:molybdenum cofactor biosynthesis protein B